jgi:hypothetical protein
VFYGCPEAAVVVEYFSKGLGAAMAAKAAVDLGLTKIIKELLECLLDQDEELPKQQRLLSTEDLTMDSYSMSCCNCVSGMQSLISKEG